MNHLFYIYLFACGKILRCFGIAVSVQGSPPWRHLNSSRTNEFLETSKLDGLVLLDGSSVQAFSHGDTHVSNLGKGKYVQTLHNHKDTSYTGRVTIAGQTLLGIMDTASSDLLSFRKHDCRGCGRLAALSCSEPLCTVEARPDRCVQYGSGRACASRVTADVSVGPFARTGRPFLLAHSMEAPVLEHVRFQAIIGLGPPMQPSDFLSGLGIQYFSACFPSRAKGKLIWNDDAPGSAFTSMPAGLAAGLGDNWGVVMTQAQLDGPSGKYSLGCSPSCGAVMDTSTSLIGVPTETYNEAMNGIKSLGGNCKQLDTLPSITFKLNGNEFTLPPEAFVGSYVNQGKESVPRPRCELLLLDLGDVSTKQGPMWILGIPFFRHYYTTFDLGSLGWASADSMKIHTAPTGRSCVPGSRSRGHRKLMKVDVWRMHTPRWLRSARAATRAGAGNTTLPS